MLKKIKLNKIKKRVEKIPWILAKRVFLTFLAFIFLSLIIGGIVFYKYSILVEEINPEITEKPIQFNKKVFRNVLDIWKEREEIFQKTEFEEYLNPFQKKTSISEETDIETGSNSD